MAHAVLVAPRDLAGTYEEVPTRVTIRNLTPGGTVALVDRRARLADDVWVVWSDRSVEFVECCRDA